MKIVACKGYEATLRILRVSLTVTQFKPVDLSGYDKKALKESNLQALFDAKWVEEYTGQELPNKTNEKIKIPTVEQIVQSGEKNTQVKFTQEPTRSDRVKTHIDMPETLAEEIAERVVVNKRAQEKSLKEVTANVGGDANVRDINELTMKKLTEEELKRPTIVDGAVVEDFKFPQQPKKGEKVKDGQIEVNSQSDNVGE